MGAAYILTELPLGRIKVNAGLRYEYNQMELVSNTKPYEESHHSHFYRHGNLFPALNVTCRLNDEHQVRLCYGRSINRPEFRELSPSVYYDFDLAANVQGNFDLKDCHVDNMDLRWEWYPRSGESVSLAAFYKHFDSPIEWVYTMAGGTDVIYSYDNAKSADNYGLELDIRKRLDFMGLEDFSLSFNGSLIHSRVHFPDGGIKACDHVLFDNDGKEDAHGAVIGNGDQEFVFKGKQTLAKGTYLLKGWVYIADGSELTIPAGTIIKGDKQTKAALIAEPGGKLISTPATARQWGCSRPRCTSAATRG